MGRYGSSLDIWTNNIANTETMAQARQFYSSGDHVALLVIEKTYLCLFTKQHYAALRIHCIKSPRGLNASRWIRPQLPLVSQIGEPPSGWLSPVAARLPTTVELAETNHTKHTLSS